MGQKAIINSLHVLQNKNWNSLCYVEYNHYKAIFTKDLACYLYLRAQSKLNFNVLKRKHIYQIEIRKSLIYHTKKGIILNLHLVYLKNLKKQFIHRFIKSLLSDMKKIFNYKNNELLLSYKVGKNTALFTALKIASLIEKRIKFQSNTVDKCIKTIKSKGVRVVCKGRLNFVDRAKKDFISFGPVPLQTLSANIDYGLIIANTKKGLQSIKVWIFN
jgi:small subunit ribosomal protein S3